MAETYKGERTESQSTEQERRLAEQQSERLRNQLEQERKGHERDDATHEKDNASHEALEKAKGIEKASPKKAEREQKHERQKPIHHKAEREQKYQEMMQAVRQPMSPAARTFSKVIHNPVVEKVSDVVGGTVARPNAILAGSISAFFIVLAVYLVARHYGYPLSGSESIAAFVIGWMAGVLYDYFRVMITGRTH